ncbi:MAG TPA: hypothetical protein VFB16_14120 [Bauldia sp.]|nr:hypothetical protein [Bauldia sp.]
MIRIAASALALAGGIAGAAAADPPYPSPAMLQNTRANATLYVRCEPPEGTRLRCNFTEMTVTKGPERAPPRSPSPAECNEIEAIGKAIRNGEPPPGVDPQAFTDRFAHQSEEQKKDDGALADAFAAVCARNDDASLANLAEVLRDRERRSCTLAVHTYRLDFDWHGDERTWVSSSGEPAGGCGGITAGTFSQFDKDRPDAWTYRVKETVTNPEGMTDNGESCAGTDTGEVTYAAGLPDIYVGCDYLRFVD